MHLADLHIFTTLATAQIPDPISDFQIFSALLIALFPAVLATLLGSALAES